MRSGRTWLILSLTLCRCLWAYYVTYDYNAKFESRLGLHLKTPRDLATHRQLLEFKSLFKYGPKINAQIDYRGFVEGALATNDTRYGNSDAVHRQSSEIIPRDAYVAYKSAPWDVRVGNQQVVWGEAFGFYFADIVNPKDLREAGIGDLEFNRIPVPMVNTKYITGDFSAQLIYIPKPYFDKLPSPGSDYFSLSRYFPNTPLNFDDTRALPTSFSNGEIGGRVTATFSNLDVSLFQFYYFDRFPVYSAQIGIGGVSLTPNYHRILTMGVTGTYDFSEFLLRMEALYTKDRHYNAVIGNQLLDLPSDEVTVVGELDYSQIRAWRLGLQLAHTYLTRDVSPINGTRNRTLVSLQADGTVWKAQTLGAILSYEPNGGSSLAQINYLIPLDDSLELRLAGEYFMGDDTSTFGRFGPGSRVYFTLKSYLHGVY